jgi:hypothetical protein
MYLYFARAYTCGRLDTVISLLNKQIKKKRKIGSMQRSRLGGVYVTNSPVGQVQISFSTQVQYTPAPIVPTKERARHIKPVEISAGPRRVHQVLLL